MKTISLNRNITSLLITDIAVIVLLYFVPAFSHLTAMPLYLAEPMRLLLLSAYFISYNKRNNYFLAFTLPLFSVFVSGHPIPIKGLVMAMELMANIFFLDVFLRRLHWNQFFGILLSILISKVIYYLIKYLFIQTGLLQMGLVSTPLYFQIIAAFGISLFIFIVLRLSMQSRRS